MWNWFPRTECPDVGLSRRSDRRGRNTESSLEMSLPCWGEGALGHPRRQEGLGMRPGVMLKSFFFTPKQGEELSKVPDQER